MSSLALAVVRTSVTASLALAAALSAAPLAAQQPDSARVAAGTDSVRRQCAYDLCAYRIEGEEIVQGQKGVPVARMGLLSSPLHEVIWSSDSARIHAARFSSGYASGRMLKAASIAGSVVAVAAILSHSDSESSGNSTALLAAVFGTAALSFVGEQVERTARRELARAIWWHNRELPR